MSGTTEKVDRFFARYGMALLARDAGALARMYAVPGLILFPGQSIVVTERAQTQAFFESAFGQYAGVNELDRYIAIAAATPSSVWADVTWSWHDEPRERFMYQLVNGGEGYEIAVLTRMPVVG
ncbi:hypothetical protein [Naasia sp. SYSU D00948]|uniref:hypothetical protein n=1 Tax=Naasia sp. SYSU D00948 TaxID=2817379 RepID=UPI001B306AD8|nr:hypothetical protein [Naasia sp. SYSU D00948]